MLLKCITDQISSLWSQSEQTFMCHFLNALLPVISLYYLWSSGSTVRWAVGRKPKKQSYILRCVFNNVVYAKRRCSFLRVNCTLWIYACIICNAIYTPRLYFDYLNYSIIFTYLSQITRAEKFQFQFQNANIPATGGCGVTLNWQSYRKKLAHQKESEQKFIEK